MKGIFCIVLLFLHLFEKVKPNTYFQKAGWVSPSTSYGHVHLSIDLDKVQRHLTNLQHTLNHLYMESIQHTRPQVKQRCQNFLKQTIDELKSARHRLEDYQKMTTLSPVANKRTKRFLGLIVALTSLSIGLYNTAEIIQLKGSLSDVVTRQHHITDILQDHEVALHHVQHNVDDMKSQMVRTMMVVEDIDAMQGFMELEIQVSKAMEEIHRMVNCIISGTERLLMHKLPLCFTNVTNLETAHTRLTRDALQRNLQPIQPHIAAYLEYETSFIIEHQVIHVFVHVPLSDGNQNLELLRFFSYPIPIGDSLHMKIDTQQTHLAISPGGFHATLTHSALEKCIKHGELHFCPQPIILKKNLSDTCLGSVYMQNYTNLQQKCPATFFEATEIIESYNPDTFMIYTAEPQTIRISCKNGYHTQHVAIKEQHQLKVGSGCKVTTNNHQFQTGYDISVDDEIQRWPIIWNISNTLFDVNAKALHDIIKDLNLLDTKPTPIRDIRKMIWMNTHHKVNLSISIVISVISILIISVVIYLTYRAYKIKSVQTQEENETPKS